MKLSWLFGGVLALGLFYVWRRTKVREQDMSIPTGNAPTTNILGDLGNIFAPPAATDKNPVGPPRIDVSQANKLPVKLPVPVTYVPPSPPSNNLQITPSFTIPSFLTNWGSSDANRPTTAPSTVLSSALGVVKSVAIAPPTNSGVNALNAAKNSGLNTTALKSVILPKTTFLRKL